MLVPSQEENTNPNETRFVSHSDVSLAYTPMRQWPRDIPGLPPGTPVTSSRACRFALLSDSDRTERLRVHQLWA